MSLRSGELLRFGLHNQDTKVERREQPFGPLGFDGAVLYHQGLSGRASHTFTVPSSLADASRPPSGLNATLLTRPVCPLRVRVSWPVPASHTFTVAIGTGGGEALAVGAERHAKDKAGVPLEGEDFLAGRRRPTPSPSDRHWRRRGAGRRG